MSAQSLADALRGLDAEFGIGFVDSPGRSVFVRRTGSTLTTFDGAAEQEVEPDWVFKARLFHPGAEWRWWWDQDEHQGRHAHLNDAVAKTRAWEPLKESQRLLRGTVRSTKDTWTLLHDRHSRPLWVPTPASRTGEQARLAIGVVEYVSIDADHGNVGVSAERFTQIREV